jgi:hypothetical protein
LQVGGKNKIKNVSEKKHVLAISCNSTFLLVMVHNATVIAIELPLRPKNVESAGKAQ